MGEILSIKDLKFKDGARVFIRCDFNVPMDEFVILRTIVASVRLSLRLNIA